MMHVIAALGGYRADGFGTATIASSAITCIIAGAVMGAIYFGLLYATRNPDFRSTVDLVLARFRRGRGQVDDAQA
jgi:putative peptidoglycan lipid II flippase